MNQNRYLCKKISLLLTRKGFMRMLVIENLYMSFGVTPVLTGVTLSIEKGKVYTLVGGNGSGKTTLVNILSGFLKPNQGTILLNGKNLVGVSPYRINRLGIGRTFQDLRLANQMTVRENVMLAFERKMFGRFHKEDTDRVDEILAKMSLTKISGSLAGEISYGQQKLLTLACLVANNANLLLIDEPVAGIDKNNLLKITEIIKELKREGKTIIQIEHNHNYIIQTSDCVIKMEGGKIVC